MKRIEVRTGIYDLSQSLSATISFVDWLLNEETERGAVAVLLYDGGFMQPVRAGKGDLDPNRVATLLKAVVAKEGQ